MDLECSCQKFCFEKDYKGDCKKPTTYCGTVEYYGNFAHLPGKFASTESTKTLLIILILANIPIILIGYLYACITTCFVQSIIEDHFITWKNKGVDIKYRPPKWIGFTSDDCTKKNIKEIGCIVFTLSTK